MRRLLGVFAIISAFGGMLATPAIAQEPIKILHMYPGTGPFEAYGRICSAPSCSASNTPHKAKWKSTAEKSW